MLTLTMDAHRRKKFTILVLCALTLVIVTKLLARTSHEVVWEGETGDQKAHARDATFDKYANLQNSEYHRQMFAKLTLDDAQLLFHRMVTRVEYQCTEVRRYGVTGDTGYDICQAKPYLPTRGSCLMYSVGINNQWSFDDAISDAFDCEIHAFDPSMNMKSHLRRNKTHFHPVGLWGSNNINNIYGWTLKTFGTLRAELGHSQTPIDILKVDAEGAEWSFLRDVIASGELRSVRQLLLEIHTPRWVVRGESMSRTDYAEAYDLIWRLQESGLRLYRARHENNCCGYFAQLMPSRHLPSNYTLNLCCYELFFVNVNMFG